MHQSTDRTTSRDTVRRCARAARCTDRALTADGELTPAAADPGLPFCRADIHAITRALTGMTERYVHLHTQIGLKGQGGGVRVTMSKTAPIPIRLDVDALIRHMIVILCSWDERIAAQARLSRPDTLLSRCRRDQKIIPAAVAALSPRVTVLLQLPPETMWRAVTLRAAADPPAGAVTRLHKHAGWAEMLTDLSGADAGLELLDLEHKCRATLGQTLPPPVALDGVPCRRCELLGLEVAPEPQYRSVCADCGDLLTPEEYREWTRRYSVWARGQVTAGDIEPADLVSYTKIAA